MKATIEPRQERTVTLEMTESDADILHHLSGSLKYFNLTSAGYSEHFSNKTIELMKRMNMAISEMKINDKSI
jgi:hypothetical protein